MLIKYLLQINYLLPVKFTLIIVLKPHTPLLVLDSHQLNYPLALPWVLPGDILKALAKIISEENYGFELVIPSVTLYQ